MSTYKRGSRNPVRDPKSVKDFIEMVGESPVGDPTFRQNGVYPADRESLKKIFEKLFKKHPELARFGNGFGNIGEGDSSLIFPEGNGNWPSVNSSYDCKRLTYTFDDAEGNNVFIEATLKEDRDLYKIAEVKVFFRICGMSISFRVNFAPGLFDFSAQLNKEQVLNLCFRSLDVLMFVRFADYFDMKDDAKYDKAAVFKFYLKRISRMFTIEIDTENLTITLSKKTKKWLPRREYRKQELLKAKILQFLGIF